MEDGRTGELGTGGRDVGAVLPVPVLDRLGDVVVRPGPDVHADAVSNSVAAPTTHR